MRVFAVTVFMLTVIADTKLAVRESMVVSPCNLEDLRIVKVFAVNELMLLSELMNVFPYKLEDLFTVRTFEMRLLKTVRFPVTDAFSRTVRVPVVRELNAFNIVVPVVVRLLMVDP